MAETIQGSQKEFLESAEAHFAAMGGRWTLVRRLLCESIAETERAFDAEELLVHVQEREPQVSLSTVYRNLRSLAAGGLVDEVDGSGGRKVYSLPRNANQSSSHLVCLDCGQVFPLDNPCLGLRESQAVRQRGFLPRSVRLRVEAHCQAYRKGGSCPHHTRNAGS